MAADSWDRGTRWLHWGLSVGVTLQLFVSLFMEVPQPGLRPQPLGHLGFQMHEVVGVALIGIVAAHWVWSLTLDNGQPIRHLFPWNRSGRTEIAADLRNLKAGRLPAGGPGGGLAGLVHGLGFLGVTGMVILGGGILFLLRFAPKSALLPNLGDLHGALADVVWLYWLGHIGMVVVHERRGHRILSGIYKP